jgi:hypothetical protein
MSSFKNNQMRALVFNRRKTISRASLVLFVLGACVLTTLAQTGDPLLKLTPDYPFDSHKNPIARLLQSKSRQLEQCDVEGCFECKKGTPKYCETCLSYRIKSMDNTQCYDLPSGEERVGAYRKVGWGNFVWWFSYVSWWILKILNTIAKIFVMVVRTLPGFLVDRLDAGLNYLNNLGGNPAYYPVIVCNPFFRGTIFVESVPPNPNESYVNDKNCAAYSNFKYVGRQCNILYNYGAKLLTLFVYLLLGITVSGICLGIYKRHNRIPFTPKTMFIVALVNDYFGVRYFVSLMEAVSAELLGDMFHNIFIGPKTGPVTLGFVISLMILIYYVVYAFGLGLFLIKVKRYGITSKNEPSYQETTHTRVNSEVNVLTEHDASTVAGVKHFRVHPLSRVPGLHPLIAWLYELHLETYAKEKLHTRWIFTPLIIFIKTVVCQFILVAAGEHPLTHNSMIFIFEAITLAVIVIGRTKETKGENLYDILLQSLYVIYILLRVFLTLDVTYQSVTWDRIQWLMGLSLCLMIIFTTLYVMYLLARRTIDFYKRLTGFQNRIGVRSNASSNPSSVQPSLPNRIEGSSLGPVDQHSLVQQAPRQEETVQQPPQNLPYKGFKASILHSQNPNAQRSPRAEYGPLPPLSNRKADNKNIPANTNLVAQPAEDLPPAPRAYT